MYAYLTENNMIYNWQFGFRANHSCNHALISCTESIKKELDNKKVVGGGGFIDLQKAFDTAIIKFYVINYLIMVLEGNLTF